MSPPWTRWRATHPQRQTRRPTSPAPSSPQKAVRAIHCSGDLSPCCSGFASEVRVSRGGGGGGDDGGGAETGDEEEEEEAAAAAEEKVLEGEEKIR